MCIANRIPQSHSYFYLLLLNILPLFYSTFSFWGIPALPYTVSFWLEITTLENAVYMNYKNNIPFVFDFELLLYEHQSILPTYLAAAEKNSNQLLK